MPFRYVHVSWILFAIVVSYAGCANESYELTRGSEARLDSLKSMAILPIICPSIGVDELLPMLEFSSIFMKSVVTMKLRNNVQSIGPDSAFAMMGMARPCLPFPSNHDIASYSMALCLPSNENLAKASQHADAVLIFLVESYRPAQFLKMRMQLYDTHSTTVLWQLESYVGGATTQNMVLKISAETMFGRLEKYLPLSAGFEGVTK